VTATYSEKIYGFTFIFDDDSVEMADDYYDGDNIKSDASTQSRVRNHLVALGVRNSNCAYLVPFAWIDDVRVTKKIFQSSSPSSYIPRILTTTDSNTVKNYFKGFECTQFALEFIKGTSHEGTTLFEEAASKKITIQGVERNGYLPSVGEFCAIGDQRIFRKYITQVTITQGKQAFVNRIWTSTQYNGNINWCAVINSNEPSFGSSDRWNENYYLFFCKY
ncbi:MAG: hypothetical protein Q4E99_06485, partial [Bacillota bacterium]|nr:hypothetical protein [Bacillota bacterium]